MLAKVPRLISYDVISDLRHVPQEPSHRDRLPNMLRA
jgi:hypothetical protein